MEEFARSPVDDQLFDPQSFAVSITAMGLSQRLPGHLEVTLFRVVQEAVTNVARHAHAKHLSISLLRRDDLLLIEVSDDGRGFDMAESGDVLLAIGEGAIGQDHIVGELGEVLIGRVPGRTAPDQVTVFKSLGLAVEDVAAAAAVLEAARREGAGTSVRLS